MTRRSAPRPRCRGSGTTFVGDPDGLRYRLLVDENVEYRIVHKLRNYGHDVEHVDDLTGLGKNSSD
ncbi:DUF5615 family PIN-like protein [Halorubrum ezzemoulense]|uniref:DUF5615 family PIN-like protein n=1 Tax=Halorubrum ezzemoulense TaxID=337243 RepID=UPI0023309FB9|nr:DUF5615 family PIN-like protein [Halorubrum ezzemoulense]MDB9235810.1 DUF5615 family PIN-like protein [Halorubrum ezzemoulense]